jgi:hypothetical protein
MPTLVNPHISEVVALICVSDADAGNVGVQTPLTSVYGQPVLHHTIKSLQNIGIKRFFVGTDHFSGSLISYTDAAKSLDVDLTIIREPQVISAQVDDDTRILVLDGNIIWSPNLLNDALLEGSTLIASVEQCDDNEGFERIDLNSRWAGMAIFEKSTLAALTQLPNGWDMASSLLRQGLQEGARLWQVRQTELQTGQVVKLVSISDVSLAVANLFPESQLASKSVEQALFSPLAKKFAPYIWQVEWGRSVVEWLFAIVAAATAVLVTVGFIKTSLFIAAIAIFAQSVRNHVRILEYRTNHNDWPGYFGWSLLVLALVLIIYGTDSRPFEAIYAGMGLAGLSLFTVKHVRAEMWWLASPLTIIFVMLAGVVAGGVPIFIYLLTLAQIACLLVYQSSNLNCSEKTTE